MGYYSNVYLACTEKAFDKFKTAYETVRDGTNFAPTEIFKNYGDRLLNWRWIKWYQEFEEVKAILAVADELDELDSKEYAYKLIEIGEDDNVEVRENEYGSDIFADIITETSIYIGQFEVDPTMETDINRIAKELFGRENLESKNNDADDFLEVSVWRLQKALEKAYELGKSFGK